jgi:hypothetical protein
VLLSRADVNRALALLVGVGLASLAGAARAQPGTSEPAAAGVADPPLGARGVNVVSGAEGSKSRPDVELGVSWLREDRTAVLTRELQSAAAGGRTVRVKDLVHRQTRQLLNLRGAVGLWRDLSLFLAMPIVLADDRWLDFDRRASECDNLTGEGASGASPSCVNETTSTLLRDGVLPGFGMARYGLDSKRSQPFDRPSPRVFQGPTRRGIEYLGVGLSWAILNQRRDDTRPTWIVRVEPRFALGKEMGFDPLEPEANRGVNPGYHQLVLATSFSKRTPRFDPQISGYYAIPKALGSSPYDDFPLGEKGFSHPQHRAGAEAGFEYVGYELPRAGHKLTFELRGTMEIRFFGLARSELWEPLSGPSSCRTSPATCRPEIDRDLDGNGAPEPYPGVTRSPSYGIFGGTAGVNAQIARWLRLRARGGIAFEQSRFLSDGRSGIALFDIPGRRWHVEDARTWHLLTDASVGF